MTHLAAIKTFSIFADEKEWGWIVISARKLTQITSGERFSSRDVLEAHLVAAGDDKRLAKLKAWIGKEPVYKEIIKGILRWSFLIESVGIQRGGATKIRTRWALEKTDPRYASYEECAEVYNHLINSLPKNEENKKTIVLFFEYSLLPYELPIDYLQRTSPIHLRQNISWVFEPIVQSLIELRAFLLDGTKNGLAQLFGTMLRDKIKTKVYLTDRVQTGDYQTNREKRWEVHPESVHFASRRSCFEIEGVLIKQLCRFQNFPKDVREILIKNGLLDEFHESARCPITFEELDFEVFKESVLNPKHGRSDFQVGHLNPLKANPTDPRFGHTAANIAWVTSHGNRLQGHLTIDEWNNLLEKIISNKSKVRKT